MIVLAEAKKEKATWRPRWLF